MQTYNPQEMLERTPPLDALVSSCIWYRSMCAPLGFHASSCMSVHGSLVAEMSLLLFFLVVNMFLQTGFDIGVSVLELGSIGLSSEVYIASTLLVGVLS